MTGPRLELTLGPLFFHWPAARMSDFYARIADEAPVDRVYLGEVVCGKRAPLVDRALEQSAVRLEAAGKTVVWSSLALPATRRDRIATTAMVMRPDRRVEINDFGGLLHRAGAPFVAGPLLNVYNEAAAAELLALGCERLCPPIELKLGDVATLAGALPGLEIELFAFGRAPLALSGRCYHARQAALQRDACRFVCDRDPDGMPVATLDGDDFLAVNGVQTLSHGVHVAALPPAALREAGVGALRLSPHTLDMVAVAGAFRALLDDRLGPAELTDTLRALDPPGVLVSGYLSGEPGWRPASEEGVRLFRAV